MDHESIRSPDATDDEWLTESLFPLKTWEWYGWMQD
jgi:hypothetical protein